MEVMVTGATGLLGGHVCAELNRRGYTVLACGSRKPEEWHDTIRKRPGCVVHLAWFAQPGDTCPRIQASCALETMDLADYMVSGRRATPMVFASTLGVYGVAKDQIRPFNESDPISPNCSYTRAKARVEILLKRVFNGRSLTIVRLGSLMGRSVPKGRERTDLVVNAFSSQAYERGRIEVWNPSSWKPVIHVKDAAREVVYEVESLVGKEFVPSYTRNLASQCVTAQHIAQLVKLQTGCEVEVGESPRGNRSAIVETAYPRKGDRWVEIPEAVKEWEGWKGGPDSTVADPERWKRSD